MSWTRNIETKVTMPTVKPPRQLTDMENNEVRPNICAECAHAKLVYNSTSPLSLSLWVCYGDPEMDVVTGDPKVHDCRQMREGKDAKCGYEGRLWKPRKDVK